MSTKSTGCKKKIFSKMILGDMERQNKCWRFVSLWWLVLALLKSQNALKMGCFGTKNGFKNGSKTYFPENDPRPFGVREHVK